jgi:hypothetical protein
VNFSKKFKNEERYKFHNAFVLELLRKVLKNFKRNVLNYSSFSLEITKNLINKLKTFSKLSEKIDENIQIIGYC